MRRIVLSMVVREGAEEEFVRAWRGFAPRIGAQPGSVGQTCLRDRREPRRYVIASDWTDEEALRAFQGTELRRALSAALEELRESAENAQYDVVARYRGAHEEREGADR